VDVGAWRVTALSDGTMRLDGGAMWGVVPKALWKRLTPSAADNTIPLAVRPFLLERGAWKVVLEPGIGAHLDPQWQRIYQIEREQSLLASLSAFGLAPRDVTHVIASHAHFDHLGGCLERAADGALVPLFPAARHLVPRREIAAARSPDPARKGGYEPELVLALERAGILEPYDDGTELLPGLVAHEAAGHSDGVCVLTLNETGPGETAIFWADVVPTTHHIQPAYIMAYDLDVPRSYASRAQWLARAAAGGWLGLFYHDAEHAFGRIRRAGERFVFEPLPWNGGERA
jgi:glyoxylase-like metal-dependent hydrolase (beta-lactamase superfamily II)